MEKANAAHELRKLYVECMGCANTQALCPGIWKDIPSGVPPRGFYFVNAPVAILVVAKNPGHPLKPREGVVREQDLLRGRSKEDLLDTYLQFQEPFRLDPNVITEPSGRFMKNLLRYLSFFLDQPPEKVYESVALTDLVKCSTHGERDSLHPRTMSQCYQQYFERELALLRPKVLLALGREVEKFLLAKVSDHRLPVVYVKHPSYFYKKEREASILSQIKAEIQSYLHES